MTCHAGIATTLTLRERYVSASAIPLERSPTLVNKFAVTLKTGLCFLNKRLELQTQIASGSVKLVNRPSNVSCYQ